MNNENLFFYWIPSFLFILLPAFLITGPFLSDLALSLISLLFILKCIKEKNFSYFKNKYFYFFIFFYFYLILNIFFNNFNFKSFLNAFFYFRFGVFVVAVIYLLKSNEKLIKHFFYTSLVCFSALIFDGYIQFFFEKNLFGMPLGTDGRVSSFFGDELILGSYISRLLPIIFGISLILEKKTRYYFLPLFILSEVLVFLSGERTSFFFINLSAIFILIMIKDFKLYRLITILFVFTLVVGISFIDNKAKERIYNRTIDQMNLNFNDNKKINLFSKQHSDHYASAYKMFKENKLFGVGVNNFRELCHINKYKVSEYSCVRHPHNTYIQVLAELGIVGLFFIISIFILFIYYSTKHLICLFKTKSYFSNFEVSLLASILIVLWPVAPSGNFFNNWLSIIYYLPLGFFFYSRMFIKKHTK